MYATQDFSVSSSLSQPDSISTEEVQHGSHGCPISPATNQPYPAADIRQNQSLLALFPAGHPAAKTLRILSPEEATARQANIDRKRKARRRSRSRSGKASKRINYASRALTAPMKATARRMDELKQEAEPEPRLIPWFRNGQFVKMLEVA